MRETCSGIEAAFSLEQMRRVVALAQTGALDEAARLATCSPAEIQAAVVSVEAALQMRLFDMGEPTVRPMPAGMALLAEMATLVARTGPAPAEAPAPDQPGRSQQ